MGSTHRSLREHPIVFGFAEGVRIPLRFQKKLKSATYCEANHDEVVYVNEIAQCAMKSSRCSDEICLADEIKSVHIPTKSDFITKVISSTEGGFIPSARTDLVEKKHFCR